MALGLALLGDALNIFNTSELLATWWPLAIILGGVAMLISDNKNYVWALLVIIAGVFLQLRLLGYYENIDVWQVLWPVILIGVGLSIVLGRSAMPHTRVEPGSDNIVALLGGSEQKNTSGDFTGSKVTSIMGGAKIDLRKATIKKTATLEIFALMGGIEIIVPRNVAIKNQTNVFMGGVENKTDQDIDRNSPTLTFAGDVIMSGVEIKN